LSKGSAQAAAGAENIEFIRRVFTTQMARAELDLPVLPEVAARVVVIAGSADTDAAGLARLITGDQSLAAHVMRVATSAIYQPRHPIESLQHAISWLGMAEVTDIAFTVAVQGKLLNVPGQKARVQKMWKLAVGTGLWARLVADTAGCRGEPSYLCGLLHEIGKPASLQALGELTRRMSTPLSEAEIDRIVQEFGDTAVNKQSTTYRSFNAFLRESEAEAQIAAQPTVMKRPVIQDGDTWTIGWTPEIEARLTAG